MIKTTVFTILILAASVSSATHACTSALKLDEAIEYSRRRPRDFANIIRAGPMKGGSVRGVSGDSNCYQEGYNELNRVNGKLKPFVMSNALNIASAYTVYLMNARKQMSHNVAGTTPTQRIEKFADSVKGWSENIARHSAQKSCGYFVIMWITDCYVSSRGHRKNLFSEDGSKLLVGAYANGYYAAMNTGGSMAIKSQFNKDYAGLGIYSKYDMRTLSMNSLTPEVDKSDYGM